MPSTRSWRAIIGAIVIAGILATGAVLGVARPWDTGSACPAPTEHPEWSVARRWDEALLDAIRRALPAPTVHARNLYHASAAMWDAWAAYDPTASGIFVTDKVRAADVAAARDEAISYAAYGVLSRRYVDSVGGDESLSEFADVMDALCHPLDPAVDRCRLAGGARQPHRGGGACRHGRRSIRTRPTATPRWTMSR